jgi:hypothetical protein
MTLAMRGSMKPLMMAALVVQLTSAGGAGSGRAGEPSQAGDTPREVGKHFSALRTEVSSLKQQFREARERAKLEAEHKRRDAEGFYEPQTDRAAAAPAASGGSAL